MTLLADLTPQQKALVDTVFAYDAHFGKDPAWYDYHFDLAASGGVYRLRLPEYQQKTKVTRPHHPLPVNLIMVPYTGEVTDEMLMRQDVAYQILARWILDYEQEKSNGRNRESQTQLDQVAAGENQTARQTAG